MKTLTHKRGDTFVRNLNFNYINDSGVRTAINIANKTIKLGIFLNKNDDNSKALLLKTIVVPDNTDSQNGIYVLQIDYTDFLFKKGNYIAEFSIIDTNVTPDFIQSTETFNFILEQDLIKNG
jgi:hypothetical protein